MKNILNNLSDEEKNNIREQHTGGMKVMTENFSRLLNSKLGDSKPLVKEQNDEVSSYMREKNEELVDLIQKEVAEVDASTFGDEFEYADNILSWVLDKFISQPGNEWLEDSYDDLLEYSKDEFGEDLFDIYRSESGDEWDEEFE